ncbi:YbdK family carboxylate-amine ligase [Agromyces sp. Leaf222]|uniref:carboxylate-amine ligase n=1 Tax=Agromyces sp. Leaf222 TaxID=1735688 RepID=UPI0009EA436F|nr:YbdK family carboxylate-amine ligase [Agromyces sp. Leaf222]
MPTPESSAERAPSTNRPTVPGGATFGIEEEFVLLEPESLRPVALSTEALAVLKPEFDEATTEFLASQVEIATGVCRTADEALEELEAFRAALAEVAGDLGVVAAATGTPYEVERAPEVTRALRYEHIRDDIGAMVDDHQVCGMHVHIGVPDAAERVRVLNGLRAWMPVLTAVAANSPFWHGEDTGFASWRTVVMRRWTTAGIPSRFVDVDDYDRRISDLVGIGATRDKPLVAWTLRLSHHLPTIELRFADAQLLAEDSVAIALLCRRIVRGILQGGGRHDDAEGRFAPEVLDAAVWEAARHGMASAVPDPVRGIMAPAAEVIASALAMHGDDDGCPAAVAALLERGTGADRQRAAFAEHGVAGVRACVAVSEPAGGGRRLAG